MNVVLIPAYKPDEKLIALTQRLLAEDLSVVVVDDGSGEEFADIFAKLDKKVYHIGYPVNKGKGAALKTGIKYIYEELPECERLVTADADGQHTCEDIKKVLAVSQKNPGALVLGSREFSGEVPFKSKAGNTITRWVFSAASGVKVRDTQTGLRCFDRACMQRFALIEGERYEYEINMLLSAAREQIPIIEETIATIYIDDNASSHFNPFKDSFKIYMCIFKFAASSFLAFIIDYVLFLLFHLFMSEVVANVASRLISAAINFKVNKDVVFKGNEDTGKALIKYALLAAVVLLLDTLILKLFTQVIGIPHYLAKIIAEIIMFFFNFPIQGKYVYRKSK